MYTGKGLNNILVYGKAKEEKSTKETEFQSDRRTHQKVLGKPTEFRMAEWLPGKFSWGEKEDNGKKVSSHFDRVAMSDYFLEWNFHGSVRLKHFVANLFFDTDFVIFLQTPPFDSLPRPLCNLFLE